MMSVEEAVLKITELKGRAEMAGLSSYDKQEVARLYAEVLGKTFKPTSCNDCYRDACIEMYLYLKKNGAMKEKSRYTLLNGFIIQVFGTGKVYNNSNLTDAAAEEYLRAYPQQIKMFASYPSDWRTRCGLVKNRRKKG